MTEGSKGGQAETRAGFAAQPCLGLFFYSNEHCLIFYLMLFSKMKGFEIRREH